PLELVLRGTQEECCHNPNEISSSHAELVLRDVPGKLAQRRRQTQRFRRADKRAAGQDTPVRIVTRIPRGPGGLRFLAARRLAPWLATRALACADPRVRAEPAAADGARSLPGVRHRDSIITTPVR